MSGRHWHSGAMLHRCLIPILALLAAPAAAAPAMFVVRDADTEITLFGTMHALPADAAWQTAALNGRVAAAQSLVLEVVLSDSPMEMAPLIQRIGLAATPTPLESRVPEDVRAPLARAVAASGIPAAGFASMKSWLAGIMLAQGVFAEAGLDPRTGVEPQLQARFKAASKPMIGLETAEQQLLMLDGLPQADQNALLAEAVRDRAAGVGKVKEMVATWLAGDIDRIAAEFSDEADASPTVRKALLTDRNVRWASWVAGTMQRPGKLFMAVGTAHLGGPEGLVALLKARGLTVERVQ